jgi:hypothetical protein
MLLVKQLLAFIVILTLVECQAHPNASYSQFELFKNTGFHPCPSKLLAPSKQLIPRRGGGSHASGGGGGGGGDDDSDSTPSFIQSKAVKSEEAFCQQLNGTSIMIPTLPAALAFVPWWPTYAAHLLSVSISYFGLWKTSRKMQKDGNRDMPLPTLFWIQLPFDLARTIAWLIKAVEGFTNHSKLRWIR